MKYLALLILTLFITAPHPAQAAATCAKTTCDCTISFTGLSEESDETTDAASCRAYCESLVTTGTANWGFVCLDSSGVIVPNTTSSGTIERTEGTTVGDVEARNPVIPILNVPIPGLDFGDTITYDAEGNLQANFLAKYIDALYRFMIVAMSIVAVVMMMIGGLQYILARGHADAVKKAKERMANSVIGVILLLAAYNIAFLINPDTVRFESLKIKTIQYEELTAESFEEMASYGQTGTVADTDVITIPSDASSSHIIVMTKENKIAQETYDALRLAASDFYDATLTNASIGKGLNIRLTSASRTVQHQAELFHENCLENDGYCSTDTCNPDGSTYTVVKRVNGRYELQGAYTSMNSTQIIAGLTEYGDPRNCYHTNNVAVDVWAEGGGGKSGFNVAWQNELTTQMFANGFCRIPNEPWHFELEAKKSSACGKTFTTSDYRRYIKGVSTLFSTASCKTWSYKSNCCTTALDNTNKPTTMCK